MHNDIQAVATGNEKWAPFNPMTDGMADLFVPFVLFVDTSSASFQPSPLTH